MFHLPPLRARFRQIQEELSVISLRGAGLRVFDHVVVVDCTPVRAGHHPSYADRRGGRRGFDYDATGGLTANNNNRRDEAVEVAVTLSCDASSLFRPSYTGRRSGRREFDYNATGGL